MSFYLVKKVIDVKKTRIRILKKLAYLTSIRLIFVAK